MFHVASTLVALSIIIPTMAAPVQRSLSEDIDAAKNVVEIAGKAVDIGTTIGHDIGSAIDYFKNKKNNNQKRRSFDELTNREEELRGSYQVREPKNAEFVEARKFSLTNVLHKVGDVVKDAATVGGIVKDVAEAAAILRRDYETDIDELD